MYIYINISPKDEIRVQEDNSVKLLWEVSMVEWQYVEEVQCVFECWHNGRAGRALLSEDCARRRVVAVILLQSLNISSVLGGHGLDINEFDS